MKISYQEAKERFGIHYISMGNLIVETFNKSDISSKSVYEEKNRLLNLAKNRYETKINKLDEFLNKKFESHLKNIIRFIFKYKLKSYTKKNKIIALNEYEKDLKRISDIRLKEIVKKDVEIELPDLKVGKEFFMTTEIDNVLKVGIYKGVITDIKYYFINEETNPTGVISVMANIGDKVFNLRVNKMVSGSFLSTNYTGHRIFENEKEAELFFNIMLNRKIDNLKKLIVE